MRFASPLADRMEWIHSRFGVSDDDKLYTLASLAFEADRERLDDGSRLIGDDQARD